MSLECVFDDVRRCDVINDCGCVVTELIIRYGFHCAHVDMHGVFNISPGPLNMRFEH